MEFVGYDTCEKLIWTSGEGSRGKKPRQGSPKININKVSPSSKLGFGCSPHKYTYDILTEDLVSCIFQACSLQKESVVLRYIKKVKYRHGIGPPKTCLYQNCVEKTGFNVRAMFSQYYFVSPVLHDTLYHFYHVYFTILPVFLYWKDINYGFQTMTMINISV